MFQWGIASGLSTLAITGLAMALVAYYGSVDISPFFIQNVVDHPEVELVEWMVQHLAYTSAAAACLAAMYYYGANWFECGRLLAL